MSSTGRNREDRPIDGLGAYDTPVDLYQAIYRMALDLCMLTPDTPILEPHVGNGNALRALELENHRGPIEVLDLDPTAPGLELARGMGLIVYQDTPDPRAAARFEAMAAKDPRAPKYMDLVVGGFLARRPKLASRPDTVILGNPPYAVAPGGETCPKCKGTGLWGPLGRVLESCGKCKGKGMIQPPPIPVAELHVHRGLEVASRVLYVLRGPFREGQARYHTLWSKDRLAEVWTCPHRAAFKWNATDSVETAVYAWERGRQRPAALGDHGPAYIGRWLHW